MKMFLAADGQAGALLLGGRKKGVSGQVKQAGPALAETPRNLGNVELFDRKGTGKRLVKTNRRVDIAGKLLEGCGGTRGRKRQAEMRWGWRRAERARHIRDGIYGSRAKLIKQRLLELAIGVYVHRIARAGDGSD